MREEFEGWSPSVRAVLFSSENPVKRITIAKRRDNHVPTVKKPKLVIDLTL
jgi:hypothetical protein